MSPSRRSPARTGRGADLDAAAKRLLAEGAAEHKAEHALLARQMLDRMRRTVPGARRRDALFRRVAGRLGFDASGMTALHARDYQTAKKQVAAQRQAVRAQLRRRVVEQQALLRHVLENRDRFERRSSNPVTQICVWRTSAPPPATLETDAGSGGSVDVDPGMQSANPVAGTNRVTLSAVCRGVCLVTLRTHHLFESTAPHDGVLSVSAFFAPVGSYSLTAAGGCFGAHGLSLLDLRARVKIRVRNDAGDIIRAPNPGFSLIVHDQTDAGCEADARAGAFDLNAEAFEASRPRVMNVLSGDRILVTAQYNLLVSTTTLDGTSGAEADFDLSSAGHGLNVPVVLMTVED